jgi:hypothetical protein
MMLNNMWKTFPFSQSHCDIHRLKSTATLSEILEALQNTVSGVGFLTHHPSLPSYTFVSADAVLWLIRHVEGVLHEEKAVEIMEVSVCAGYNFVKYQIKGCCPVVHPTPYFHAFFSNSWHSTVKMKT